MAQAAKQRPEALATFAEAARGEGKKPDDIGLVANDKTAPIPTDSKKKDDAATRVLQEGVTGQDRGADAAIDELPDRIVESRKSHTSGVDRKDESKATGVNMATAGAPTSSQGASEEQLGEEFKTGKKLGP